MGFWKADGLAQLPPFLLIDAAAAGGGREGSTGTTASRGYSNDNQRVHAGSERAEARSPFKSRADAGIGYQNRSEPTGYFWTCVKRKSPYFTWLLVGAIGFESAVKRSIN